MDIINLLAPYRSKPYTRSEATKAQKFTTHAPGIILEFSAKTTSTTTTKTTVTKTNSSSASGIPQLSLQISNRTQSKEAVSSKATQSEVKTFLGLHKKVNLKFARDAPSQAENRRTVFNQNIKQKRDERKNINRGISRDNLIMDRLAQKPDAQMTQLEKLQKWKREKAELMKLQKQQQKPPMTAGVPRRKPNGVADIPPKPLLTKAFSVNTNFAAEREKLKLSGILKKAPGSASSANSSVSCSSSGSEKRAEFGKENELINANIFKSKSTNGPMNTVKIQVSPVPNEMLDLFVPPEAQQNENPNVLAVVPKMATVPPNMTNSPAFKKRGGGGAATSPVRNLGGVRHSPAIKKLSSCSITLVQSPTFKKVKKPKGMQFDSVYIQFNTAFTSDAKSLLDYVERWTKILEEDIPLGTIPEEVVGDIESSVGQARLLLDSKLPQFAELLYFYLTRTANPFPTLACDLEGWWEVASLSISKVKDRFDKLEKMSRNRWMSGDRKPLKPL